jgi:hypothetical protein
MISDSEENAQVAVRVTSDVHKAFRPHCEAGLAPFIDAAERLFAAFPDTVAYHLHKPGAAAGGGGAATETGLGGGHAAKPESHSAAPAVDGDAPKPVVPALRSCRLLTELPLVMTFLFQVYPKLLSSRLLALQNLFLEVIQLPLAPFDSVGAVPPHLRMAYADCRAAQVKAVSFIAFQQRQLQDHLRPHAQQLAAAIARLLIGCPEAVGVRKELLVATRHVLSSPHGADVRAALLSPVHVATLLDEDIILGPSLTGQEAMRMLGMQLMSEVAAHLETPAPPALPSPAASTHAPREPLSAPQLAVIVRRYSACLRDPGAGAYSHSLVVRMLMTTVEFLYAPRRRHAADETIRSAAFDLLSEVHAVLVGRVTALALQAPSIAAAATAAASPGAESHATPQTFAPCGGRANAEPYALQHPLRRLPAPCLCGKPGTCVPPGEWAIRERSDAKGLLKQLLGALKTVTWTLGHFHATPQLRAQPAGPGGGSVSGSGTQPLPLTPQAAGDVAALVVQVPLCVRHLFFEPAAVEAAVAAASSPGGSSASLPQLVEVQEALDLTCAVLGVLSPPTLCAVLSSSLGKDAATFEALDALFAATLVHPQLLTLPHGLLASSATSAAAAPVLATYLTECRMPDLVSTTSPAGNATTSAAAVLTMKLWSLTLQAVARPSAGHQQHNAQSAKAALPPPSLATVALKPHLGVIVEHAIRALHACVDCQGGSSGVNGGSGAGATTEVPSKVKLLRYVFRALSHAPSEQLLKELAPFLRTLMEALQRVIDPLPSSRAHASGALADAALELCLSLPATAPQIAQLMPMVVRPMLLALQGGVAKATSSGDGVAQAASAAQPHVGVAAAELQLLAMRCLETWIDFLGPVGADTMLGDASHDVHVALWELLRAGGASLGAATSAATCVPSSSGDGEALTPPYISPPPPPSVPGPQVQQLHLHAQKALQLLGKLGSKARDGVLRRPHFDSRPGVEHGCRIVVQLQSPTGGSAALALDRYICTAVGVLMDAAAASSRAAQSAHTATAAVPVPPPATSPGAVQQRAAASTLCRAALSAFLNASDPLQRDVAAVEESIGALLCLPPDAAAACPRLERAVPAAMPESGPPCGSAAEADAASLKAAVVGLCFYGSCGDVTTAGGFTPADAATFVCQVATHGAVLAATSAHAAPLCHVAGGDGSVGPATPPHPHSRLPPRVIIDGLLDALCNSAVGGRDVAMKALGCFFAVCSDLTARVAAVDAWSALCHRCHGVSWPCRSGAVTAIAALAPALPPATLAEGAALTTAALLACLRDLSPLATDSPASGLGADAAAALCALTARLESLKAMAVAGRDAAIAACVETLLSELSAASSSAAARGAAARALAAVLGLASGGNEVDGAALRTIGDRLRATCPALLQPFTRLVPVGVAQLPPWRCGELCDAAAFALQCKLHDFSAEGTLDVLLALLNATSAALAPEPSTASAAPAAGAPGGGAPTPSWAPPLSATPLERTRMQLLRFASALLATPEIVRAPAAATVACALRCGAIGICFTYLCPACHGDVIMASSTPGCPPTPVAAAAYAALRQLASDDMAAAVRGVSDAVSAAMAPLLSPLALPATSPAAAAGGRSPQSQRLTLVAASGLRSALCLFPRFSNSHVAAALADQLASVASEASAVVARSTGAAVPPAGAGEGDLPQGLVSPGGGGTAAGAQAPPLISNSGAVAVCRLVSTLLALFPALPPRHAGEVTDKVWASVCELHTALGRATTARGGAISSCATGWDAHLAALLQADAGVAAHFAAWVTSPAQLSNAASQHRLRSLLLRCSAPAGGCDIALLLQALRSRLEATDVANGLSGLASGGPSCMDIDGDAAVGGNLAHLAATLAELHPGWLASDAAAAMRNSLLAAFTRPPPAPSKHHTAAQLHEQCGRALCASLTGLHACVTGEDDSRTRDVIGIAWALATACGPHHPVDAPAGSDPTPLLFALDSHVVWLAEQPGRCMSLLTFFCDAADAAAVATPPGADATAALRALSAGIQLVMMPALSLRASLAVPSTAEAGASEDVNALGHLLSPQLAHRLVNAFMDIPGAGCGGPPAAGAVAATSPQFLIVADTLRCELLLLGALLSRHCAASLAPHRRELIRFGWSALKRDDSASKGAALLCTGQFLASFTVPDKIVLQVFVAMLRAYQPEHKALVRCALDALVPMLPRRLLAQEAAAAAGGSSGQQAAAAPAYSVPIYVRYIKKMLAEEGHLTGYLHHVWSLLTRHPGVFYPSRAAFVPTLLGTLNRLAAQGGGGGGSGSGNGSENRQLALDVVWLVCEWERRARAEAAAQSGDDAAAAASGDAATMPPPRIPPALAPSAGEVLVNFVCRLVGAIGAECGASSHVCTSALALAAGALQLFPTAVLRMTYLDKYAASIVTSSAASSGGAAQQPPLPLAFDMGLVAAAQTVQVCISVQGCAFLSGGNAADGATSPGADALCALLDACLVSQRSAPAAQPPLAHAGGGSSSGGSSGGQNAPGLASAGHAAVLSSISGALDAAKGAPLAALVQRLSDVCIRVATLVASPPPHMLPGVPPSATPPPGGGTSLGIVLRLMTSFSEKGAAAAAAGDVEETQTYNTALQRCMPPLLRALARCLRDIPDPGQQRQAAGGMRGAPADADVFGSATSNVVATLALLSTHGLAASSGSSETRGGLLRILHSVLEDAHRKLSELVAASATPTSSGGAFAAASAAAALPAPHHLAAASCACAMVHKSATLTDAAAAAGSVQAADTPLSARECADLLRAAALCLRPDGHISGGGAAVVYTPPVPVLGLETAFNAALLACLRCGGTTSAAIALRTDAWSRVELALLLGSRARDGDTREAFETVFDAFFQGTFPGAPLPPLTGAQHAAPPSLTRRLAHCLHAQDWEPVAASFWLRHSLTWLLRAMAVHGTTQPAHPPLLMPNAGRLPPLLPAAVSPNRGVVAPAAITALAASEAALLKSPVRQQPSVLDALRTLVWHDPGAASTAWVSLFPIVWSTLGTDDQMKCAKPLLGLLTRDWHLRTSHCRVNCVQALLEGISVCHPQPKVQPELVRYLGSTFNAWHIALPVLESHVMLFPQEHRCFDALAAMYSALHDGDTFAGLWRQRCAADATRTGLALRQHGQEQHAQDVWLAAGAQAVRGGYVDSSVPKAEMCLWTQQWLSSTCALGQWDALAEWAASTAHAGMAAEAAHKRGDWNGVRTALAKAPQEDLLRTSLMRAGAALHEGASQETEAASGMAVRSGLERWAKLPGAPCAAHVAVLRQYQTAMETAESGRMLAVLGSVAMGGSVHVSDARDVVDAWRKRGPGAWEPLDTWHDIMNWRGSVLATATGAQTQAAAQARAGGSSSGADVVAVCLRERELNTLRLATSARRHGCPALALHLVRAAAAVSGGEAGPPVHPALAQPPQHWPSLDDAPHVSFQRARVSAQASATLNTPADAAAGLAALHTLDIGFVCGNAPHYRAELFRLRGILAAQAGDPAMAGESFAAAAGACATAGGVWASWGQFCEAQAQKSHPPDDGSGRSLPQRAWVTQAMTCYAMALKHGALHAAGGGSAGREACKTHTLCGRMLALLTRGSPATSASAECAAAAASVFEASVSGSVNAPVTCWAFWIPQLVLCLERDAQQAAAVRHLLARISVLCPHAAYYTLRAFVLERRDAVARATGGATRTSAAATSAPGGAGQQHPQWVQHAAAAGEYARECREKLRHSHPVLVSELETLLLELPKAFQPSPEENLLAVVHALVQKCYRHPSPGDGPVPASVAKELGGVYRACFSADTAAKHPGFYAAFQTDFQADLEPGSAAFPATLSGVTSALRRWRTRLHSASDAALQGRSLRVEACSSVLAAFRPHDMELPGSGDSACLFAGGGGGAGTSSTSGGNTPWLAAVRLHSLVPDVTPLRRGGVSHRALTFLGADGSTRRFIMSSYSSQAAGSGGRGEERVLQLLRTLNACLGAHPGTRSRPGCSFYVPACVSVWPHVRLVQEDASCVTLAQVYDAHCSRNGKDPDAPSLLFKSRLDAATTAVFDGAATAATSAATTRGAAESMLDERLAAFGVVCKEQVSENILSQFAYKTMPQPHSLLVFRRTMASQLALCGLVGHAARCGGRQAQRLAFSRATGGVHQLDFGPVFAGAQTDGGAPGCPLAAPCDEPVPFRLTRNLHSFFTPFTVEGVFVPSLAAAADACTAHVAGLDAHCGLFFADLVAMAWKGGSSGADSASDDVTQQLLRDLATRCASDMVARITDCAPQGSSRNDSGGAALGAADVAPGGDAAAPPGEVLTVPAAAAATNGGGGAPPLHRGASWLVEQAMSPAHLCRMPLDWQPWL